MGLYETVAELVRLPDASPSSESSSASAPHYIPPPTPYFEKKWESFFEQNTPPAFGKAMLDAFFPTLVGDLTAFDDKDPDLSVLALANDNVTKTRKEHFTFLAHGSYGATSRPTLDVLRKWQLRMEASPVRFFYDTLYPYLVRSIREVASVIGATAEDVVLITNVEVGMNAVLRSLTFEPREKIIAFDVTYTAVLYSAQYICERTGAELLTIPMTFPVSRESVVADLRTFLEQYDPKRGKIRLGVFQHITSPTAIVLPIRELISLCHEYGILVMVDGAHAIGQIELNLAELGADFYVTNCHKWLCSARGCAVLWVDRRHQKWIHPLTTTWGHPNKDSLLARFIWQGTADYSPFLALNIALKFYKWIGVQTILQRNQDLARWGSKVLTEAWETSTIVGLGENAAHHNSEQGMQASMCCIRVPESRRPEDVDPHDVLLSSYNIEVPVFTFRSEKYVRVSVHIYNNKTDCLLLGRAMLECLGYGRDFAGYAVLDREVTV